MEPREDSRIPKGDAHSQQFDGLNLASTPKGRAESLSSSSNEQDSWAVNKETIVRYHRVPRVILYVPSEESFPILSKSINVTRWTGRDLDKNINRLINHMWIDERDKDMGTSWTGNLYFVCFVPNQRLGRSGLLISRSKPQNLVALLILIAKIK